MTKATIAVAIDWSGDGDWADTGEVVTTRVLHNPGITLERGRDQIRALAPPMAGACSFSLNNQSKDYSPENVSSPLYGNLVPGRAIKVTANGSDLWRGYVDDLPQQPRLRGGSVGVPGLGTLSKLKGKKVSTDLYPNGAFPTITTDIAMGLVFIAAGLGSKFSALDTGKTTLTAWWCGESDAFAMLVALLAAEGPGAALYETADGLVAFHSRHYRLLTARCTTSQATFGNGTTEPKHAPPFGYQPNLKGVVNSCAIEQKILALGGTGALWTYGGGSVELGAGLSRTFDIALSTPSSGFSANLTAAEDLSIGELALLTTTITRYNPNTATWDTTNSGTHARLTVTNGNGRNVTLAQVRLDGPTPTVATETVANGIDTAASIAKYGLQSLPGGFAPWPYLSYNTAQNIADAVVSSYQEPRATVTITVNNANATRLAQQLARDISDRITVQESQTGINGAVYIERIRHVITEGGLFHATEFGCEQASAYQPALYDAASATYDTARYGF